MAAGLLRLGFVADLLSRPTQLGYMNGLALTILISQLPKLCGFSVDADGLLPEAAAFVRGVANGEVVGIAVAVGAAALALILLCQRFLRMVPGVLVAVVLSIAAVRLARPDQPRGQRGRSDAPRVPAADRAHGAGARPAPAARRSRRHRRGLADRHHLDRERVRGARRGGGRREPGDGRRRCRQPGGRSVPGVPRLDQWLPDGGRGAERRTQPAGGAGRRGRGRRHAAGGSRTAREPAPARAGRRRDRGFAVPGGPAGAARDFGGCGPRSSSWRSPRSSASPCWVCCPASGSRSRSRS